MQLLVLPLVERLDFLVRLRVELRGVLADIGFLPVDIAVQLVVGIDFQLVIGYLCILLLVGLLIILILIVVFHRLCIQARTFSRNGLIALQFVSSKSAEILVIFVFSATIWTIHDISSHVLHHNNSTLCKKIKWRHAFILWAFA